MRAPIGGALWRDIIERADPNWAIEPKHDGDRAIVHIGANDAEHRVCSRHQHEISDRRSDRVIRALADASALIDPWRGSWVDGELIGSRFIAHDLICAPCSGIDARPLSARYDALRSLIIAIGNPSIALIDRIAPCDAKAFMSQLRTPHGSCDGIVCKQTAQPYAWMRSTRSEVVHWAKFKP